MLLKKTFGYSISIPYLRNTMQEQKYPMNNQGEIILYQPDETIKVEVRLEDETVWLTQAQMAELFDVKEHTINYHIKENITWEN